MTGTIHGLTGGLIARFLPLPIALPVALLSHFVLDALPHYGIDHAQRDKSRFWKIFFIVDSLTTLALALYAIVNQHYKMFLGGLFATAPDYIWVGRVIKSGSFDLTDHGNWFTKWHASIQRYERPWGIWLELPIMAVLFYVVMIKLW